MVNAKTVKQYSVENVRKLFCKQDVGNLFGKNQQSYLKQEAKQLGICSYSKFAVSKLHDATTSNRKPSFRKLEDVPKRELTRIADSCNSMYNSIVTKGELVAAITEVGSYIVKPLPINNYQHLCVERILILSFQLLMSV